MTPTEWAAVLDAHAKAERLEAHHAVRPNRDPQGRKLAQEAVRALQGVITLAAPATPVLGPPERPEWVSVVRAARLLGITKRAALMRAKRGAARGTGRRAGRGWELHLPSQAET